MARGQLLPSLYASHVAYWPLWEISGNRGSVEGSDLTLTDANTVTQNPGIQVYAAQFTAANAERLTRVSEAKLQLGDIDFSYVFWVYMDTLGVTRALMSKYANLAGQNEFLFYITTANVLRIVLADGTTTRLDFTAAGALLATTWYMLHYFHDATNNIGGVSINAGARQTAATSAALGVGTAAFFISGSAGFGEYHNGRLCEASKWNRLLSVQEEQWLYNNGSGRTYPFDGRMSPVGLGRGHGQMVGMRRNRLVGVAV